MAGWHLCWYIVLRWIEMGYDDTSSYLQVLSNLKHILRRRIQPMRLLLFLHNVFGARLRAQTQWPHRAEGDHRPALTRMEVRRAELLCTLHGPDASQKQALPKVQQVHRQT